ncbi:MAG TPA: pyridoxal phosphate-dependent aminotransferase [Myxococcales bacterium]|nr:pyridoxal phosphate-dependent aminotransferase [Myxococcales bacterium]HIL01151.1 pyridoxal phosphate-dependent aminotransferase [Myxococcales bacterium]
MAGAQFDGLDIKILRSRKSEKWHAYPADVLPAWVAEMDFPVAQPIQDVLSRALDLSDLGYPIAAGRTGIREAFADRMEERFGWSINPRRVEVLSEVVQGLYLAVGAFTEPGDGAIVQTAIYPPFLHGLEETGRRLVENRLVRKPGGWEINFEALENSIDARTKLFLLCNPHNPSGRVLSRPELERLGELVLKKDLIVVADEIHADLVFDSRRHIPFASLAPELEARTVTLNSASKSFNIAGLRCAVAHFGSTGLRERFDARSSRHLRGGLGMLGLYATTAAWREGQPWLDEAVGYLEANRNYLMGELKNRFPGIRCEAPEGTYLAWLDCSGLGWEESPTARFLERGKVALSDGANFGSGFEQFTRLNFATSREILEQVLVRMETAIQAPD